MDNPEPLLDLIGRRVAQRRSELGLSLDEAAERTGVSRAMVSRIERGEVHASAVVLDRLCGGLGITLSALFQRDAASPLLRRADQPFWKDPETRYERREIAPAGTGSPVRIAEVVFPPGTEIRLEKSRHRLIDQHIWVLAGEVEISLPGATYSLAVGDCLHMHPDDGIIFRNRSDAPARYAVVLTVEPLT